MLRHRFKTQPYKFRITTLFRALERVRVMRWKDCFNATDPLDIKKELIWGVRRKVNREKAWDRRHHDADQTTLLKPTKASILEHELRTFDYTDPEAFEKLLTDFERRSLQQYRINWPDRAWSLNQNGKGHFLDCS